MRKRGKAILALTMAVSMALAGCGSGDSSKDAGTGDGGSKKVTLRLGTWEGGDALKMQQQIVDNYKKSHPDVDILIEAVPDQYGTKLLTQIAGNQAPDIFQIGDGDISMFKSKGALEDLTNYMNGSNGIKIDDYYQSVLDVGKIDGKYYTMPKDYSNVAVYYNKKLFDEAQVPYPQPGWTWEQFNDTAKKLTKRDGSKITQWGANLPGASTRMVLTMINSYGGNVISEDGNKFEGVMNSDGTVKAMELYRSMYFTDQIAPSTTESQAFKGVDLFATGKVAMSMTGRWPVMDYKKNPELKWGVAQLPVGPNGAANAICYAGYGIYSKSENKDAAWDYMKYLTGPDGQNILAEYAFTAVKSVADSKGQTRDEYLKPFLDDIQNIKPFPEKVNPLFNNSGGKAFTTFLETMMLGKSKDVKKELDEAAKTSEAELEKLKKQQ